MTRIRCGCLRGAVTGALTLSLLVGIAALPADAAGFSDEAVEKAIRRGAEFLWSRQRPDGSWETTATNHNDKYTLGPTAINVYALLESGVHPTDPRMTRAIKYLEKAYSDMTYCLAFRALAYGAALKRDPRFRNALRKDVRQLILSIDREGGYTYVSPGRPPAPSAYSSYCGGRADQSNSQYGLLGVWAGALHGEEVPKKYWQLSLKYWLNRQAADGGWGYSVKGRPEPYMAMSLAGLASLYVCTDNLHASQFLSCRGNQMLPAIEKALAWIDEHFAAIRRQGTWFYYTLYGIERIALASGRKHLGGRDWYRFGAEELLARQAGDGSWTMGGGAMSGTPCATTAYALLFLLRGRRPVLFNRLEYDGDWNNRPRALANLTRWFGKQFEREVHWQTISIASPVAEWHDAPLLCLTGSQAPKLTDEQVVKLRRFVHQGGTLFSLTECGGAGFRTGIRDLYAKLFPDWKLADLPAGHDIYTIHYRLPAVPKFLQVFNGARPVAVHCDLDLPRAWQANAYRTAVAYYRAAANVVAYTNDKPALSGELRARGVSHWPEAYNGPTRQTVRLARLRHGGNCDPEPGAYERFARLMARRQKVRVEVLGPMEIDDLAAAKAPLATLTGTGTLTLSEQQIGRLKAWLDSGGTLLIDAAGGDEEFASSAEALLEKTFGRRALRRLAGTAEVYTVEGFEMPTVGYRRRLRETLGASAPPRLKAVFLGDRPAVYFSADDITCGLVGYPSYTVQGYSPNTCFALVRNLAVLAAGTDLEPQQADRAVRQAFALRNNDRAAKALDGDLTTKWTTGAPMRAGDWFTVDLGKPTRVTKIVLDTRGSPTHHPRGFTVFLSRDGKAWRKALDSKGGGTMTGVKFPKNARVRHVKFELTGAHPTLPWSVHEVVVETAEE